MLQDASPPPQPHVLLCSLLMIFMSSDCVPSAWCKSLKQLFNTQKHFKNEPKIGKTGDKTI